MSADQLLQELTNALVALIGVGAVFVAIRRPRRANVSAALRSEQLARSLARTERG